MSGTKTDGTELTGLARLENLGERISVLEKQRSEVVSEKENLASEIRQHHRLEAIGEKPYGGSDRGKDLDRSRELDLKLEEVSVELDGLSSAIPQRSSIWRTIYPRFWRGDRRARSRAF